MKIILSNHYWNKKYTVGIELDTPGDYSLKDVQLVIYETITENAFKGYIALFKEQPHLYTASVENDGKNENWTIIPKYIKL
jgi:hypothetical protein